MRAFIKFNRGMLGLPLPVQFWVLTLLVFNLALPLYFFERLEAQVVLASLLTSMTLMTILTDISGFTRLLSWGHVYWIPLLMFLWTRLDMIPADDAFGFWIRGLIAVNAVSLVFDGIDIFRYQAGDRAELVKGL